MVVWRILARFRSRSDRFNPRCIHRSWLRPSHDQRRDELATGVRQSRRPKPRRIEHHSAQGVSRRRPGRHQRPLAQLARCEQSSSGLHRHRRRAQHRWRAIVVVPDVTIPRQNTIYSIAKNISNSTLYAASSSIHDIYQSTHLTDASIDGGTGLLLLFHRQRRDLEHAAQLRPSGHLGRGRSDRSEPRVCFGRQQHVRRNLYDDEPGCRCVEHVDEGDEPAAHRGASLRHSRAQRRIAGRLIFRAKNEFIHRQLRRLLQHRPRSNLERSHAHRHAGFTRHAILDQRHHHRSHRPITEHLVGRRAQRIRRKRQRHGRALQNDRPRRALDARLQHRQRRIRHHQCRDKGDVRCHARQRRLVCAPMRPPPT